MWRKAAQSGVAGRGEGEACKRLVGAGDVWLGHGGHTPTRASGDGGKAR
jgi:hypothetical protein